MTDISVVESTLYPDDQSWIHEADPAPTPGTLDISSLTPATHYPDGFIPSGFPLGIITVGGLYSVYAAGAANGTETLVGFLRWNVGIRVGSTGDHAIASMTQGKIRETNLPAQWSDLALADRAAGKVDVGNFIQFLDELTS